MIGEVWGKMKSNEPGRQKLCRYRSPLNERTQHANLYSDPHQAEKGGTFDSPAGLPPTALGSHQGDLIFCIHESTGVPVTKIKNPRKVGGSGGMPPWKKFYNHKLQLKWCNLAPTWTYFGLEISTVFLRCRLHINFMIQGC